MATSEFLRDVMADLRRDEGVVPHAYTDSEGYLTIGVGRLIDKRLGGGLAPEEIEFLLRNDLQRVMEDLASFPWWRALSPDRKRALINMRFNLGPSRFRGFRRMLRALDQADFETAAREAADSKWFHQVGARGLRIVDLIRG